jgi:Xaa-Pro aminopeptidase
MKKDTRNILMIAATESDANLYYVCKFLAPDPIIFIQIKGKKHLLMNDLEVDRAREQASVDQVHSTSALAKEFYKKHNQRPGYVDLVAEFLKKQKVKMLSVPGNFGVEYADELRHMGFDIKVEAEPFFPQRLIKEDFEVKATEKAIRYVEVAFDKAVKALQASVIKRGRVYLDGSPVTSESLRKIINVSLMENACVATHTIVACGKHAVDPHNEGTGPIFANQSIIMDIFPRDSHSRYHADFTRTVCKGKASPELKKMYAAVHEGQEIAFKAIKPGADASKIHAAIHTRFEELGFKTGLINGRMQGFFHGTGHGLGLDIHELPRFGGVKEIFKEGHIVTVEPGLYYEGLGGVRLEDVVVITKTGCKNLTRYPRFLEIA